MWNKIVELSQKIKLSAKNEIEEVGNNFKTWKGFKKLLRAIFFIGLGTIVGFLTGGMGGLLIGGIWGLYIKNNTRGPLSFIGNTISMVLGGILAIAILSPIIPFTPLLSLAVLGVGGLTGGVLFNKSKISSQFLVGLGSAILPVLLGALVVSVIYPLLFSFFPVLAGVSAINAGFITTGIAAGVLGKFNLLNLFGSKASSLGYNPKLENTKKAIFIKAGASLAFVTPLLLFSAPIGFVIAGPLVYSAVTLLVPTVSYLYNKISGTGQEPPVTPALSASSPDASDASPAVQPERTTQSHIQNGEEIPTSIKTREGNTTVDTEHTTCRSSKASTLTRSSSIPEIGRKLLEENKETEVSTNKIVNSTNSKSDVNSTNSMRNRSRSF